MHPRLEFQRRFCSKELRILNVGSKEDPANLKKDFDAVNVDINKFENVDVIANACSLPFKDKSFDVAYSVTFSNTFTTTKRQSRRRGESQEPL